MSSANRFFQDHIDDGSLVLWHDYRSGSLRDWSGRGNDGTFQGTPQWDNRRVWLGYNTQNTILVADSASLRLGSFTLASYVALNRRYVDLTRIGRLIMKRDGGGNNYDFIYDYTSAMGTGVPNLSLITGGVVSTFNYTIPPNPRDLIVVSCTSNQQAQYYVNGVFVGQGALAVGVIDTAYNATMMIGNYPGFLYSFDGGYFLSSIVLNRQLTATEHAQMYDAVTRLG